MPFEIHSYYAEFKYRLLLYVARVILLYIIVLCFNFYKNENSLFLFYFMSIILTFMVLMERSIRKINIDFEKKSVEITSKSLITSFQKHTFYFDEVKINYYEKSWRNVLYLSPIIISIDGEKFNYSLSIWSNFKRKDLENIMNQLKLVNDKI